MLSTRKENGSLTMSLCLLRQESKKQDDAIANRKTQLSSKGIQDSLSWNQILMTMTPRHRLRLAQISRFSVV